MRDRVRLWRNFVSRGISVPGLAAGLFFWPLPLPLKTGFLSRSKRSSRTARSPETPPEGLTWSPDGKHLTYLDGGELIDLDPGTGKPHVLVSRSKLASLSGAQASEQDKDHRDRYKMASYMWAPDSKHLLFDSNGRLWLYDLGNGTGIQVGFTDTASGDDPKFSPNGETISFVRNHGLSIVRPRDMAQRRSRIPSPPRPIQPRPTAKWTGSTKKSSTCAAITSGRPIQRPSRSCR